MIWSYGPQAGAIAVGSTGGGPTFLGSPRSHPWGGTNSKGISC